MANASEINPSMIAHNRPEYCGYDFPFLEVVASDLTETTNRTPTPIQDELETNKYTRIHLPSSNSDFAELSRLYDTALAELGTAHMAKTFTLVDPRNGHEAGNVRKERKVNDLGVQTSDPKNIFQFNEQAKIVWDKQFSQGPECLRAFLNAGYEHHAGLLKAMRHATGELDENHPGMLHELFPRTRDLATVSFMRLVRYDAYEIDPSDSSSLDTPVAVSHKDICWFTIQAWSNASGFWGRNGAEKVFIDDQQEGGIFFASETHRKIYGRNARIKPLIHGVGRVVSADQIFIPERTAVVLFMNPWRIDPKIQPYETKGLEAM